MFLYSLSLGMVEGRVVSRESGVVRIAAHFSLILTTPLHFGVSVGRLACDGLYGRCWRAAWLSGPRQRFETTNCTNGHEWGSWASDCRTLFVKVRVICGFPFLLSGRLCPLLWPVAARPMRCVFRAGCPPCFDYGSGGSRSFCRPGIYDRRQFTRNVSQNTRNI